MNLSQPYYIEKRKGNNHINLNGQWDFCYSDKAVDRVNELTYPYSCFIPSSVYHCLHKAGVLPHPYKESNCKEYS